MAWRFFIPTPKAHQGNKAHKCSSDSVGRLENYRCGFMVWGFIFVFLLLFLFAPVLNSRASVDDLRDSLQKELDEIQAEIDQYRSEISRAQSQSKTLNQEIKNLDNKKKQVELEIKQTELVLRQTQLAIIDKSSEIGKQETKLERERELLVQYLRGIHEFDQENMIELIFSQKRLSDVFSEMNALETIQERTYATITEIKTIKEDLQEEKNDLSQRQEEELQLKSLQEIQRQALRLQQTEKNKLLTQTKGEESAYQKLLQKAKSSATEIKKQMYLLEGVGLSMTLEEAYKHAKFAADRTGVRPAFLLAVLKQESSWGTNVGTGTWKKDMRPADQKAFVQICDELNLDPDQMPVSRKPSYGWGGAMGPAQFLPTTWLGYKDRVAQLTGHNPPSPWNIDDAFTAAAVKLSSNGANQQTQDAEWKAAMIYFAGSNWNKSVYRFYGDSVMELARVIQEQLDIMLK
ncbi:MAG: lytic murein transglycosylase [Candidatus Portnoybacteria bacterium]|nr:lytic murein transglycosylase [Candidatus Portnoybacteria bacterium]